MPAREGAVKPRRLRSEVSPAGGIALARAAGGGRADLRIERPPVNVLGAESLHDLARQVRAAGDARLLVLTGLAAAFSAGVDVAEHAPEPAAIDSMLAAMRDALEALVDSPAVTLAAAAGRASAAGRRSSRHATSCCWPTTRASVSRDPPRVLSAGAAALLPGLVGQARATDWILSGRILSGRKPPMRALPRDRCPRRAWTRRPNGWPAHPRGEPRALAAARTSCARGAGKPWPPDSPRRRTPIGASPAAKTWPEPFGISAQAGADSIPRHADRLSQRPLPPGKRGRHLAARSRVPVRGRDLRGRALRPGAPLPPGGAPRADARGPGRDPDQGDARFLRGRGQAPARRERPRREGRLRLRPGVARRGAPLPRLSGGGHHAHRLRVRARGGSAAAPGWR